jgi:hypothetical protein
MVIIIRKVYKNSSTKQKLITIPKDADINSGDYVLIEKVFKTKNG